MAKSLKKITVVIVMVLAVIGLLFIGLAVFYALQTDKDAAYPPTAAGCRRNLQVLSSAINRYLAAHQGGFPANWKQNPRAWMEALDQEEGAAPAALYCRKAELPYRFNPELAGKSVKEISHPDTVWLLCDPLPVHFKNSERWYLFLDGSLKICPQGAVK